MIGTTKNGPQERTKPREPLAVQGDTVAPGESTEYSFKVPESAEITGMTIICYSGQEWQLLYRVYVRSDRDGDRSHLIRDISNTTALGGNNDRYEFDVNRKLESGDEIVVEIENVDTEHEYTSNVVVDVDYETDLIARLREVIGR